MRGGVEADLPRAEELASLPGADNSPTIFVKSLTHFVKDFWLRLMMTEVVRQKEQEVLNAVGGKLQFAIRKADLNYKARVPTRAEYKRLWRKSQAGINEKLMLEARHIYS